jgi:hypothetical protein
LETIRSKYSLISLSEMGFILNTFHSRIGGGLSAPPPWP